MSDVHEMPMNDAVILPPSRLHRIKRLVLHARVRLREEDKRKHLWWSLALMLACSLLLPFVGAIAAVFALGLVKECWDRYYGSGFCRWDILANTLGILAACPPVLALRYFAGG